MTLEKRFLALHYNYNTVCLYDTTHQLWVAHCEVPLECQDDVGEDGTAEGHVVDWVEEVHEQLKRIDFII